MTSDLSQHESFVYWLHRPFFDLTPADEGPLSAHGPLVALQDMDGSVGLGMQHCYGERFRVSLLRESGLGGYAGRHPAETADHLRTPPWRLLCEWVQEFPSLGVAHQVRVLRLLVALSFHRLVLQLCPPCPGEDEETATRALMRAFAEYTLKTEAGIRERPRALEEVARAAPARSMVRHSAAMILLTDAAKVRRDLEQATYYRAQAAESLGGEPLDADGFRNALLVSRFYRGASFVPYLAGDTGQVEAEMDIAEDVIRHARPAGPVEAVLARESLFFVTESRMREAQWRKDHRLAQARARDLTVLDPWNAKAHIEYGEVLFTTGNVEAAAVEFQQAARLAPPGRCVALFLLGQCREALGDPQKACDAYLRSLQVDPLGVSTTMGVVRTAAAAGLAAVRRWGEHRLQELVRMGVSPERVEVGLGRGRPRPRGASRWAP